MCNSKHIPTVVDEGKTYLNGKEYDLSEFYAPGLGDPITEAVDSDTATTVAEAAERNLMPGDYISGEVREAFMQAVSKVGAKAQPEEA